jgi:hypothetical protein
LVNRKPDNRQQCETMILSMVFSQQTGIEFTRAQKDRLNDEGLMPDFRVRLDMFLSATNLQGGDVLRRRKMAKDAYGREKNAVNGGSYMSESSERSEVVTCRQHFKIYLVLAKKVNPSEF